MIHSYHIVKVLKLNYNVPTTKKKILNWNQNEWMVDI